MDKERILIVEDDEQVLSNFRKNLEREGYDISTAGSGKEALSLITRRHFDLVLSDIVMDGMDGLQLLEHTQKRSPRTLFILITGYGSLESAVQALREGAAEYLIKPCSRAELSVRIRRALDRQKLELDAKKYEMYQKIIETLGAVAHEINNPLTAIRGNAELLSLDIPCSHAHVRQLSAIIEAADGIADIVQKMREVQGIETKQYTRDSQIIDIHKSSELRISEAKRVLIVDDEAAITSIASDFLRLKNYDVDIAGSGVQALEKIKTARYSVVVLDVSMPEMDGYETLQKMNGYYTGNNIRIPVTIMITGFDTGHILKKCRELDVFAVLNKPFKLNQLFETVQQAEKFVD